MVQALAFFEDIAGAALDEPALGSVNRKNDLFEIGARVLPPDIENVMHAPAEIWPLEHVKKGLSNGGKTSITSPYVQVRTSGSDLMNADGPASNTVGMPNDR